MKISSSQMKKKYLKNSATICDKNLQHNGYRRNVPYYNKVSEKAMAPHSSTLAWKIPWTEEPGRLQFMGSLRIRHDWATSLSLFTFIHWRRKWQPTPVFLPGESQGMGLHSQTRLKWLSSSSNNKVYIWWAYCKCHPQRWKAESFSSKIRNKTRMSLLSLYPAY